MSTTPAPRRSQRERKALPPQSPDDAPPKGKRKRADSDSDDDEDPKPKRKTKQSPATKKPRKTRKAKDTDDAFDPQQAAKESKINPDNPLFNAILNPAAALQSTAEDFLESLDQSPGLAQAELINLVLRACGCNESLDADQVLDFDGVLDVLDEFTEGLKKEQAPTAYPLTSKLPLFKKFRKSLHEFLERLIDAAASLGSLYTSDLIPTLQAWVIAMSSSQIRSFRHTATVVALELESVLCDVTAAVEKEAALIARTREGQNKRRGKPAPVKNKDTLDAKATTLRGHREKLHEFIKDFVDGVFVHRYRDLDPIIRADCILALGTWFIKYPAHFLDATYLRYIGWVLSDPSAPVRLAAVRALAGVYAQPEYAPQVHHFTERFKGRMLEMAARDVDIPVRVAVLGVLEHLGAAMLEEDEREQVALCVFDAEPKVRHAVAPLVRMCWLELVDERLVGRAVTTEKEKKEERARAGVKALGGVMVRWGARLDAVESAGDDDESTEDGLPRASKRKAAGVPIGAGEQERMGRAGLVVESLWDDVEAVSDWETLLDVLLLDHSSAAAEDGPAPSRRGKPNGKAAKASEEGLVDEAWRLDEEEETVLIEVLVASLRHAKAVAKKGEDETVTNDITRALIKGLPRLLMKYQTDQNRIANVLTIPTLMNLDLYLEMRMITGYAGLWDDIMKQFLSHSAPSVLNVAVRALMHLMAATSLSNTNSTKILELEDELSSALRDAVAGRDEIEVAGFDEDEVIALGALCTRLSELCGLRDMSGWMEEDEGGKQSSAWDIVSAIVERGRLGYKEEAFMITQALDLLSKHLIWKVKRLRIQGDVPDPSPEELRFREKIQEQRDSLLEKLTEYAVGTQSNTAEAVTRTWRAQAFMFLVNLHILFGPAEQLSIALDDEVQFRCAGYVQAEIERYAETLVEPEEGEQDDEEDEDEEKENDSGDEGSDDGDEGKKKGKGKARAPKTKKRAVREVDPTSEAQLLTEYSFLELILTFIRAIRAGVLHVRHTAILLSHYGRLGATFGHFVKSIVEILREEGMERDNGDVVVVVINQALREAFTLVLDGIVADESNVVQLAKHLVPTLSLRGAHLAVLKSLDPQFIVQIHTTSLSWITKRIAGYETNGNKKALRTAITFFKALIPLLPSVIQSRDAMKIKAHMDQVLEQAKVEVSATSKQWEPQRAYEKRLVTLMSKDKAPGTKVRKAKANKGDATSSEDETDLSEVEKLVDERGTPPAPRPRPRPKRLPKKTANNDGDPSGPPSPDPATPKPRPRPRAKATYQSKAASKSPTKAPAQPSQELDDVSPARSPARSESPPPDPASAIPATNRPPKRPRPDEEEEEQDGSAHDSVVAGDDDMSAPEPTPAGDMQIRRKRARH
ncbi:hypothetical protein B0H17DRAFT_1127998 [Mycena rosella]|uniref:SCD domain-containing protein n=1 Tax=Mycena rosella TaxID=1033263 RepID=A0AAD7DWX5_MYCRO|nr:hypothetical protein B0H17DRAFT_1127998 [Mycena rosella]